MCIDRYEVLRAPATGVWQAAVEPMPHLATGTLVGRLTDPYGALVHEVRAPFPGLGRSAIPGSRLLEGLCRSS